MSDINKVFEYVLDTETTGFYPETGDKLVEIGIIEICDRFPTGKEFHHLINPLRNIPQSSTNIHGITDEDVQDKPIFDKIAQDFLDFIGDGRLVIHNASFDMKFLNTELKLHGYKEIPMERCIDTIEIAKKVFPGAQINLDALCKKLNINNSSRVTHGALIDAKLLSEVYIALTGGRQGSLHLKKNSHSSRIEKNTSDIYSERSKRVIFASTEELKDHHCFLKNNVPNTFW